MTSTDMLGTAVITGASSGIGALYAERLARRGYAVVLVARNAERLAAVADRIRTLTGRDPEVMIADLERGADLQRVAARLQEPDVRMLVNNAGFGLTGPLIESDPARIEAMIRLNVSAVTTLSLAAARAFAQRGSGSLIQIASIVALAPELLNGAYSATKAYVLNLSQALHAELRDKGVRVQVVLPGATSTEFWDIAGTAVEHLPAQIVMSAADLVDAAIAGFDAGEVVTIPSLPDAAQWEDHESTRRAMLPNLSLQRPAERYLSALTAHHAPSTARPTD